ncbi:hypothetical protein SK128_012366 [Halocaridina rubra]|uniref:Neurotransmitter-gated ion-channel transmembrane domain-containing protein n=1 Tax=Halocaridina rubra TaxID=373956 RepID=A0AAN8X4R5_HALRR
MLTRTYDALPTGTGMHLSAKKSAGSPRIERRFPRNAVLRVGSGVLAMCDASIKCLQRASFNASDRIMVSLTSLLVLTGLLTQTSQSIPKTAYLKLIDVWYVVLIVYDFLVIVTLVIIECLRLEANEEKSRTSSHGIVKVVPSKSVQNNISVNTPQGYLVTENQSKDLNSAQKLNKLALVIFPAICVIFCTYFFVSAFQNLQQ